MVEYIKKRDGKIVVFDKNKIINAILPAMKEAGNIDYAFAVATADKIADKEENILEVESVQDMVENALMKEYPDTARKYILYRNQRTKIREMKSDLMKHIKEKVTSSNIQSSNANVDERSFGARKNEAAGVMTKSIAVEEMLDPDVRDAWENNLLYIHDITEYIIGQHNCLNIDLNKLLTNGFYTRNGGIRPARSFATACQLVAVIFQANSQTHFGGVGSVEIDKQLAPFVRISFLKHFKTGLEFVEQNENKTWDSFSKKYKQEILDTASVTAKCNIFEDYSNSAYKYAREMLDREGKQAAQALYHNLNSLESRPGSQLAFVSCNFGLDTTFEGRCVSKWLLEASIDGIGKYRLTAIFPISIFRYKKDINDRPGTPNYDLFKLSIKSLSKRIYPNIVNTDWISNKPDIHPTHCITVPLLDAQCKVIIYKIENDKMISKEINIKEFATQFKEKYDCSYDDKKRMYYIDLRFENEKLFINDKKSKYNDYCFNSINDTLVPINYISFDEKMTKFALTTSTFRYDYINQYGADSTDQGEYCNYEYKSSTEMATMGCRTMIGYDRYGCGWDKNGRGNVAPVTMNITKLAIQYGICLGDRTKADLDGFEKALDNLLQIAEKSLLDRYKYICSQPPAAAYFMYDNGTIVDAEESLEKGTVEPSMRHNTLSIGFLGLANTLYALFGKYHNQSQQALDYGFQIVKKIYDYTKEASKRNNLNFSCYFTPAESCCYTIMQKLQKEFGIIKGVTDHAYLVNSVHVPPYEKISIKDKIDIEAKFDWMGTAGHILYIEFDAHSMNNPEAIENIIRYAMDANNNQVGYFAINFPIDNCLNCGHSGVMEDGKCPVCGASGENIQMLRRVTGYLTADYKTRFNKGKQAEVEERIKHSKYTNMKSLLQK